MTPTTGLVLLSEFSPVETLRCHPIYIPATAHLDIYAGCQGILDLVQGIIIRRPPLKVGHPCSFVPFSPWFVRETDPGPRSAILLEEGGFIRNAHIRTEEATYFGLTRFKLHGSDLSIEEISTH